MPYCSSRPNNLWTRICSIIKPNILLFTSGCQDIKVHTQEPNFFEKVTFFPCTFHAIVHKVVTNFATHPLSRSTFYSDSRPAYRKVCTKSLWQQNRTEREEKEGVGGGRILPVSHFSWSKAGMLMFHPMAWRSNPQVNRLHMGWSSLQAEQQTILLWPWDTRKGCIRIWMISPSPPALSGGCYFQTSMPIQFIVSAKTSSNT